MVLSETLPGVPSVINTYKNDDDDLDDITLDMSLQSLTSLESLPPPIHIPDALRPKHLRSSEPEPKPEPAKKEVPVEPEIPKDTPSQLQKQQPKLQNRRKSFLDDSSDDDSSTSSDRTPIRTQSPVVKKKPVAPEPVIMPSSQPKKEAPTRQTRRKSFLDDSSDDDSSSDATPVRRVSSAVTKLPQKASAASGSPQQPVATEKVTEKAPQKSGVSLLRYLREENEKAEPEERAKKKSWLDDSSDDTDDTSTYEWPRPPAPKVDLSKPIAAPATVRAPVQASTPDDDDDEDDDADNEEEETERADDDNVECHMKTNGFATHDGVQAMSVIQQSDTAAVQRVPLDKARSITTSSTSSSGTSSDESGEDLPEPQRHHVAMKPVEVVDEPIVKPPAQKRGKPRKFEAKHEAKQARREASRQAMEEDLLEQARTGAPRSMGTWSRGETTNPETQEESNVVSVSKVGETAALVPASVTDVKEQTAVESPTTSTESKSPLRLSDSNTSETTGSQPKDKAIENAPPQGAALVKVAEKPERRRSRSTTRIAKTETTAPTPALKTRTRSKSPKSAIKAKTAESKQRTPSRPRSKSPKPVKGVVDDVDPKPVPYTRPRSSSPKPANTEDSKSVRRNRSRSRSRPLVPKTKADSPEPAESTPSASAESKTVTKPVSKITLDFELPKPVKYLSATERAAMKEQEAAEKKKALSRRSSYVNPELLARTEGTSTGKPQRRASFTGSVNHDDDGADDHLQWKKPEWTKNTNLKSAGKDTLLRGEDLQKPITHIKEAAGNDLGWKKPDWTTKTLRKSLKGDKLKAGEAISRPIGGIKQLDA